jgi:cytochrome c-type biogenesis protein
MQVSLWIAFLAGMGSFFSPCVFSLMPAYLGYLGGTTIRGTQIQGNTSRWQVFVNGTFFVLGFTCFFVLISIPFSVAGQFLYDFQTWLAKIGGIIVILFGLHLAGLLHISWFDYDLRLRRSTVNSNQKINSFLMGLFFSAGWAPCVGPVLGFILTLAFAQGSLFYGVGLLVGYSLGMAVPFLLMALGANGFIRYFQKHGKALQIIQNVSGYLMIMVGVLLFFGIFEKLAGLGNLLVNL